MIQSKYVLIFLWIGSIFLQSCLTDEPTFKIENSKKTKESLAIVTHLHTIQKNLSGSTGPCFDYIYPLELGFNTGISISVTNRTGLEEAAKSQVNGLHVTGVEFPFSVVRGDDIIVIENEVDFTELLILCKIKTMHHDFFDSYANCYEFAYPFAIQTTDSVSVSINNAQELHEFKRSQQDDFQPLIVFPVQASVFETNEVLTVNNYFELYGIINECEGCPNLFFTTEKEFNGVYIFNAEFEGIDRLFSYDWFIGDEFIETDGQGVQGDNRLVREFAPGEYKVCIKTVTDDCKLGVEYCSLLVVEDPCPDLSFEADSLADRVYLFTATFELKDNILYTWQVRFKDNKEVIFEQQDGAGMDNRMEYQFSEAAEYEVCIEYIEEQGPCTFKEECKTIVIN